MVGLSEQRSFVVADIPGIIEGAHQGKGLGIRFLQHVERTRVLAFLIPLDSEDPQAAYEKLRGEVAAYSPMLASKTHVVLLSKRDLLPPGARIPKLNAPEAEKILPISSASGEGVDELKEYLWRLVEQAKTHDTETDVPWVEEDA